MRKYLVRSTALAATTLAALLSLTACGGDDTAAGASSSGATGASGAGSSGDRSPQSTAPDGSDTAGKDTADKDSAGKGSAGASASGARDTGGTTSGGADDGAGTGGGDAGTGGGGDKSGYGQLCGANDLTWAVRSRTQAGGYLLVSVKARPGITCTLPSELPTVAFGSDGTEAGPAEQSVGEPVKLSGGTTAYAGVNPKTTHTDYGKELSEIIVAVGQSDRTGPVALKTGAITVDRPIVTNWHTAPADAVPGDGLDSH